MIKKIFQSNFITSMLILLVSFVLIFGVLFEYFESQMFEELGSEADYISYIVKNEGFDFLDNLKEGKKRITLISANGTVLADTLADVHELENHADRKEVRDALAGDHGTSARYSKTLMQKTLYYAKKLDNGNIIRISTTQNSVLTLLLGLLQPLIFISVVALIISILLSYRISKSIVTPINLIDLDNPETGEVYEELSPLFRKIANQKKTIEKQIKDAKQKQEEFRLITENMSEGLLIIDKEFHVLSYNQSAMKLLDVQNMSGDSALTFNRSKGFRNAIKTALSGEHAEESISVDGKIYRLTTNPVYDNERIIGAVMVIIDITESSKREQLRREFTSNVSHELKTPLTSISGFAEIMKAGGIPEKTVVDFSTSIYDETQRLITLVSDIMKISELDEPGIVLENKQVDLQSILKSVLERLSVVADKKNIKLNLIGGDVRVWGNEKIIDEMLYNLCDNAVKYNKENGTVDIILSQLNNNVSITVKDTGIGIPAGEQSRVFERFYRVDRSHSKVVKGTGLGLAIVKHGAIYHNAKISLESTEGLGTSVTITFES